MNALRSPMLAAGVLACGVAAAQAEPLEGFYVGAGAGVNLLPSTGTGVANLSGSTPGVSGVVASAPSTAGWNPGFVASASAGYGFGNGVRLELEANYRQNRQSNGSGAQGQLGIMTNLLFDFDIGTPWMVPYIGVGGGYAWQRWNNVSMAASNIAPGGGSTPVIAGQTLGLLAYQVILGAAFPVAQVPGLAVTAEYRYSDTAGSRSFAATGTPPGSTPGQPGNATHVTASDTGAHSVMLGLRYALDAAPRREGERPPLAPVPAPAAQLSRTYLVFFDWDRADLTPRARDVIAEAARNSAKIPHTRIDVTGHADASGTAQANLALSQRRAGAVAAEMQRWGVRADEIQVHAAGDTQPLLATSPGAREPQNRVVEIVYR